jgi:peptide/nickel transport system substrate-binding protein
MNPKQLTKLISSTIAAIMIASFVLIGCSPKSSATPAAAKPTTFTYGIDGDPGNNVNVITTSDRMGLMEIKAIYSPLYMYNADGIKWFLATDATTEDNLTYTVKLRQNVKWSDGKLFSADDVVFTYEKMLTAPAGWANAQLTFGDKQVEVKKVDDNTVTFTFPVASAASKELFANVFIMPKHIYENEKDIENSPLNAKPVGTGPYVLADYKAGEYVKFTANKDYFLGAPKIDTVIFQIITNANTGKLALQKGEINALVIQPSDAVELAKNASIKIYPYSEGRVAYMVFNTKSANVAKPEVRKALMYALDRDEINMAAYLSKDYVNPVYSFLPSGSAFQAYDKVEKYAHNVDKSKEMLAAAGVSGLKLKLGYVGTNVAQQKQATIIQQELKAVGVDLELVGMDGSAISPEMQNKDSKFDMFLGGYIMGIDPSTFFDLFRSDSAYNYSHLEDKDLDALFAKGATETDASKRTEIYTQIQQHIQDNAAFFPFADNKRLLAITANVSGVEEASLVPVYAFEDMSKLFFK